MNAYLIPLKTAIFTFIVLANVIALPLLFWEYHKKGALTFFKGFMIYSFIFYLLTAFFMTLLPLPTKESVAALTSPYTQLIPFMFIQDIIRESVFRLGDTSTYFPALTQGVILQVVFNVFLTLPFGIYLRYYFKKSFKQVLFYTFLMSLFYEVTQITGVYGIYPRPYRLFDVDDLFLNTCGGLIGYAITPAIVFLFPSREKIDEKVVLSAARVPFLRRVFAYLIDYNAISILLTMAFFYTKLNRYTLNLMIAICMGFTFYLLKGKSIGLRLMNLKVVSTNSPRLRFLQSMIRAMLFSIIYNFIFIITLDFFNYLIDNQFSNRYVLLFYVFLMGCLQVLMVVHVIYGAIIKRVPLIYEKLSNTKVVSSM